MEGVQFNIELTAIALILVALAGWVFKVARSTASKEDLKALEGNIHTRLDAKISSKEATARYESLRDDVRELKDGQVRFEEHHREDNKALRDEIHQLRDILLNKLSD